MTGNVLWYREAVFYQLHVKTFCDSDGDGIGDFKGLTSKRDYLQGLGVDCLRLLPTFPSSFRDDGYDIADDYDIHPGYGTLDDFRAFVSAVRTHHPCHIFERAVLEYAAATVRARVRDAEEDAFSVSRLRDAFVGAYRARATAHHATFLPPTPETLDTWLRFFELEKAL